MYDAEDTVWYIDPPYQNISADYYMYTKLDHKKLIEAIFRLKGFAAVSGYADPLYDSYPWSRTYRWAARALLNSNDQYVEESLWLKDSNGGTATT